MTGKPANPRQPRPRSLDIWRPWILLILEWEVSFKDLSRAAGHRQSHGAGWRHGGPDMGDNGRHGHWLGSKKLELRRPKSSSQPRDRSCNRGLNRYSHSPMRHIIHNLSCIPSVGFLVAGLFFSGCSKSEPANQTTASGDKKAKSSYIIGMSQCNLGEPWRVEMNAQIKAAADKHPNLKVIFKDAQNDTLKQRAHVEEFVGAGVDLIIISPKEAQPLTEPVAKAIEAGIPVIVLDRRVLGDKYTCFIGADNKKIGRTAGEWIKQKLGGIGKV